MKKLKFIFLVLSLGLIIFNSCKKDDTYDWGSYKPALLGVNGVTEVVANTNLTYEYSTIGLRGGSTYTWAVIEGADMVSITAQTGANYNKATLAILQESATAKAAKITVFETTGAGVVCDKDTVSIVINPYVAVNLDAFCGAYIETSADPDQGDGDNCSVTIARDPADQYFGLKVTGVLGESWWFQPSTGVLKFQMFGVDNSTKFIKQDTGIRYSTYGAVFMEQTANGSFNLTDHSITLLVKVTVAAGSFGTDTLIYTPDTK